MKYLLRTSLMALSVMASTAAMAQSFDAGSDNYPEVQVYKSTECASDARWENSLEQAGFDVSVEATEDIVSIKANFGLEAVRDTCYLTLAGDYLLTGPVAPGELAPLFDTYPNIIGISASISDDGDYVSQVIPIN